MILSHLLPAIAFASQVIGGNILTPPYRNVVGTATQKACGSGVSTYLSKNPTAELYNIEAAEGPGYNAATCNIAVCAGYQFTDSPASRTVYLTTAEALEFTVNYTIPAKPLSSSDYYDLYVHTLTLAYASNGYPVWSTLDVGTECGTGSTPCVTGKPQTQTFSHPSVNTLDAYGFGDVPSGSCSKAGQCYISWQLVDYFRQPTLVSSRIIDVGCVDVVITW